MAESRSFWRPTSRLGACAVAAAAGSAAGFWAATVVPDRTGWSTLGMAGAVSGLGLGVAGGVLALAAVGVGGERAHTVMVAFVPFCGAVYLIRRSLATA